MNWSKLAGGLSLWSAVWLFSALLSAHGETVVEPSTKKTSLPFALESFDTVWETIYEHHFDTNFNGHDWLRVRNEYRPRAAAAHSNGELRKTMQEMIDLLHVSHMAIIPGDLSELLEPGRKKEAAVVEAEEEERGSVGMDVRFKGTDLLVTRVEPGLPAAALGVRPGWVVTFIGRAESKTFVTSTAEILDRQRREFLAWRAAARKLSGPPGSEVQVRFLDEKNAPRSIMLTRVTAPGEAVQFGTLPVLYAHLTSEKKLSPKRQRIGVIRFNIWMLPTALGFNKAIDRFRDCDAIIIDLRGNIGGMVGMIIGTAGHFLNEPARLGALMARDNTFQLPANPRFVDSSNKPVKPFSGPVAVLVDEVTASASEVFAGGLQELGRARVFGRTSSGQALPAMMDELPNGDAFYHPIADFVTPKGMRFEGRGVVPDEAVKLDRTALLNGRDLDLEAAIGWVDEQKKERK